MTDPGLPQERCCPDCGATPGQHHQDGCDVARCPECGTQAIQCDEHPDARMGVWSGEWPGTVECREFGWFCYWSAPGPGDRYGAFVPCAESHPGATPDLNRLAYAAATGEVRWDKATGRYQR